MLVFLKVYTMMHGQKNIKLYGKYCYLMDMKVRFCERLRLQVTNLWLTVQFLFT